MKNKSSSLLNTKSEKRTRDLILKIMVETGLTNGTLVPEDLKDCNLTLEKIRKSLPKKDKDFFVQIIKYEDILKRAEMFIKQKDWDLVYVLFATYFEHFINEIIIIYGSKNKIAHKTLTNIIRKLNIEDKFTWLLEVMKFPKFSSKHLKNINFLSAKRNTYIHYKYEPRQIDEEVDEEAEWEKISIDVKKAISYSKKYKSKVVWEGQKGKYKN